MNQAIFQESIIRIPTPEQVFLEYPLAGFPRRALATLLDGAIIVAGELMLTLLLVLLGWVYSEISGNSPGAFDPSLPWFTAIMIASIIMLTVAPLFYFVIFEYQWNGQTPGKRVAGIRVIRTSGLSIDRTSASLRNLFRILDLLPTSYMVGIWSMMLTSNQQRLGDLVAGTIVISLPKAQRRAEIAAGTSSFAAGAPLMFESKRAEEDRAMLDDFLRRRQEFDPAARIRIARMLANKHGIVPGQALTLLEQQLYEKFKSI
jgi:uncharacterized RDD family membrane protein YckC